MFLDQVQKFALVIDRDTFGIQFAGQYGRILAAFDIGNLRRRESNDLYLGVVAIESVKIMEVTSGGSHNDHFSSV